MIIKKILDIVDKRWDYYYLKKQLYKNKKRKVNNIIVGSSYGIFGLTSVPNSVNFSLPSQDFYYAIQLAKKAMEENIKLENIYLCFGYYSAYCDVSKSKEQGRIDDVYYPLLHDEHNKKMVTDKYCCKKIFIIYFKKIVSVIIDVILQLYFLFKSDYFDNKIHTRERRKLIMWEDVTKSWGQLSEAERKLAGSRRASAHEKQMKYADSMNENMLCLKKLYEICQEKNIYLYFLNFPFSKEYLEGMSKLYKEKACNVQEQIKRYCDNYIDFNTLFQFEQEDFVDCDHLSDIGAKKISQILKEGQCNNLAIQ